MGRPASSRDIALAYRLILGRAPDEEGRAAYAARVRDGLSLEQLIESLLGSTEYAERREQMERRASARHPHELTESPGHNTIRPTDIIAKYSVEELNQTADEYYRRITDATPLMRKPFAFLHETPETLQNLGYLLDGLRLGTSMTVLDFGAGTCWLSRILAQLDCQPICCDVSPSALEIGRRMFVEHPPIGTAVYAPIFLPFDGHRIDLPDASVDRIISFDAFHHVPNQREVLGELGRVLKPGGIAGFSEPGPHHSQSPQSQYEMQHHRVLENDINLDVIFDQAKTAGFTDVTVALLTHRELTLAEYAQIADADETETVRDAAWDHTRETMANRTIFFLHKGAPRRDSRGHLGLAHQMTLDHTEYDVADGECLRATVRVTNVGDATWLHTNAEIFGIVRVGTHLYDEADRLVAIDHSRHGLPRDVEPGEEIEIEVEVPLPTTGVYRVVFDLVAEGVTWFENTGSRAVSVRVVRERA